MKIARIEIQNYKAFQDLERFDIDGKNVLIYGNNGSGKTSFAHALQALIQSSTKSLEQVHKAFDRSEDKSVVNLDTPADGKSFVRIFTDNGNTFEYSVNGNTQADPTLQGANHVSDFMNYRVLIRFYSFRESQVADIFPIFRDEFFPYWTAPDRGETYQDWLNDLNIILSGLQKDNVTKNSKRYKLFLEQLREFNNSIQRQIINLIEPANTFLKVYLSPEEPIELKFQFPRGYDLEPEKKFVLMPPIIQLAIDYDGKPINHPHTFKRSTAHGPRIVNSLCSI